MYRSGFQKNLSLVSRLRSFRYAFAGIRCFFQSEPNAWLHGLASASAIGFLVLLHCSRSEWLWILASVAAVWTAELFNTAIEQLADFVMPQQHPAIGKLKDLSAAAVLVTATAALVTGLLIFLPKLF